MSARKGRGVESKGIKGDGSPTRNIRFPLAVFGEMLAKDVSRVGRRFLWNVHEAHVPLLHFTPPFAMITERTSRRKIRPNMLSTHMTRNNVVDGQSRVAFAAILAGIIVTAEYFAARLIFPRAGA